MTSFLQLLFLTSLPPSIYTRSFQPQSDTASSSSHLRQRHSRELESQSESSSDLESQSESSRDFESQSESTRDLERKPQLHGKTRRKLRERSQSDVSDQSDSTRDLRSQSRTSRVLGSQSELPREFGSQSDSSSNQIDPSLANVEDSEMVTESNEDVILENHRGLIQGDILVDLPDTPGRGKRGAVRPKAMLWPDGIIFYKFAQNLGQLKVQLVKSAMQHIEDYTCVQFRERDNNQTDYLDITSEKGCYSWVGLRGGPQEVSVGSGCVTMGIIAHELAHAMGFYHEQSRPDRDLYVELIAENVKPGQIDNFKMRHVTEVDSLNVPYDYGSIMHYGLRDFSSNHDPTLRTLQHVPDDVQIGQRVKLSEQDIRQANLLYKCPDQPTRSPDAQSSDGNSRKRNVGMTLDSIMIVGGTQDTTEPMCIDGMTYKGDFVMVTMCALAKGSMKWVWTDNYQLQNAANTLCLSVQEHHEVGGTEDVPIKMSSCDSYDDKQKWICSGGFLKNVALNKCINTAWRSFRRNFLTAVSSCDNADINQVMSVYGLGKRYEPVCRRWSMAPEQQCRQQFPTERSYLGCQSNSEAMIGFEKVGKRNNLKAIKSVECCQLTNKTGSVIRTSIRTINKMGSTECHEGFFVQGIRLHKMKERNLKALAYLHCIRPSDDVSYDNCYWDELRHQKNNKGLNVCSRGGFFMTGIYKKRCIRLSCISQIKCCSVSTRTNNT